GSNQGWGRWEINPAKVLTQPDNVFGIFLGNGQPAPNTIAGRFGSTPIGKPTSPIPNTGNQASSGNTPPYYGIVDFDASAQTTNAGITRWTLPQQNQFDPMPNIGVTGASPQSGRYQNGMAPERQDHPLLYNPFQLNVFAPSVAGDTPDRVFDVSMMRDLI